MKLYNESTRFCHVFHPEQRLPTEPSSINTGRADGWRYMLSIYTGTKYLYIKNLLSRRALFVIKVQAQP